MARHDEVYKGIRFIVDSIAGGGGQFGYQAVVDGKRPIIEASCGCESEAMDRGIDTARAKIDSILLAYRSPG